MAMDIQLDETTVTVWVDCLEVRHHGSSAIGMLPFKLLLIIIRN